MRQSFRSGNGLHAVKFCVENRNLTGAFVRSGLAASAKCVECAAEDEKQELNEAMAELQELTTPSKKTPTAPDQREKQQSQLQPPPQR